MRVGGKEGAGRAEGRKGTERGGWGKGKRGEVGFERLGGAYSAWDGML